MSTATMIAEDNEDAKIYAKLSKEHPEGLIPVSKEEQEEFEKWLGVYLISFIQK